MSRGVTTAIIGLLKVCFLWAATIFVIIPWTLSQQHLIHLLGVIYLGGGSIIFSAYMTKRIYKQVRTQLFP